MTFALAPHKIYRRPQGPVVVVVMDGVGCGLGDEADAVRLARTPTLDGLTEQGLFTELLAHGRAVGLPSDSDMGNSEVGHNALGAGRVYEQGASLVDRAIAERTLFNGQVWQELIAQCVRNGKTLHLLGLLSDGNVHSHIRHLFALLDEAVRDGVRRLYVHALLDGRDVPRTSATTYIDMLEHKLTAFRQIGIECGIASGGGRMQITMDRYEADWPMVARGFATHVYGEGRQFPNATEAVLTYRQEKNNIDDQNLPAFVIARDGKPIAPMQDGDAVILFNFRGDRAIEISRAFEEETFAPFDRGPRPQVVFAGMMEYDGDLHIPRRFLVSPPAIERTMGEFLVASKISQLALSETQKFGHVTYFWNGNRSGKFDDKLETYLEIPSDRVSFDERPWMKAAEITDALCEQLLKGQTQFARVNYANGDMVGHTGNLAATMIAMEAIDLSLGRLSKVVAALNGVLMITADHGNADEMAQRDSAGHVMRDDHGKMVVKTSHSLARVPFILWSPKHQHNYKLVQSAHSGIANVTATTLEVLGFSPPADYLPSLLATL